MGPLSWRAAKIFLAAGTPIQRLISGRGDTHIFCVQQALEILKNDGFFNQHALLTKHQEFLFRGVRWADKGWKNFSHYYDPQTGTGIKPWPDARLECKAFFKMALSNWQNSNRNKAFFFLGASAHIMQDLCVPHHSTCAAFSGHQTYENWVSANLQDFSVFSEGIYKDFSDPDEWINYNAKISRDYFPYVAGFSSQSSYKMVTGKLLPLAQRTTAGFFSYFLNCVKA
ncbi:MAG: phospholipase [Pelotomaculum sp.]|uniref:Phospholipase C n=1 Tax=Pelotomaculum thermopropionicum (strain DSM 13744 / JCM 10971 / SI) TaxID=370438 RepID=A5D2J5_PELTS|nr:phospholipase [Pelotomaculum sp.]BAF59551.1 hypothetical protein PTH_1370 [Pelotomaculum thermopropionicum SI]